MAQEFPKALYHKDGRYLVAADADAVAAAGPEWGTSPTDAHLAPKAAPIPVQSHQEPLVEAIAQRVLALLAEVFPAVFPAVFVKPAPRKPKE